MSSASPAGKHVLVVDDDREFLRLVERWLTTAGYSVTVCASFEAAKHQLVERVPDVLLADVRLGAFNGLQLVILAKSLGPQMSVLVMSGFEDLTLRKEALLCGARYLPKPFTRDEILATLEAADVP